MNIIETITFDSRTLHALELAARGENQNVEDFLSNMLTRIFRGIADIKGIEFTKDITPGAIQSSHTARVADHAAATLAAVSAEQPLGALPSHSQAAPEPAAPTETQPEDPAVEEEMLAYFDR